MWPDARTIAYFDSKSGKLMKVPAAGGSPTSVCDAVNGRLRWELRLTWLGGTRILDRTQAAGFDVFNHRPRLRPIDAPRLLWKLLRWG